MLSSNDVRRHRFANDVIALTPLSDVDGDVTALTQTDAGCSEPVVDFVVVTADRRHKVGEVRLKIMIIKIK